jgi:methionine-gamma-lyase
MKSRLKMETRVVRSEGKYDGRRLVSVPIYQSALFPFQSAEEGAALFAKRAEGYFYTRFGNPTHTAFEKLMANLEGGEEGVAFSSGMAAILTIIYVLCKRGGQVLASNPIYGGTYSLFADILPAMGVDLRYLDAQTFPQALPKAVSRRTQVLFLESPTNPTMDMVDIEAVAGFGKKHGIPVVVDNTFATPYHQQPLEMGATAVLHSATKYLGGHGDTIGGIVVADRGLANKVKQEQIRMGNNIAPFTAWLLIRGIKTLALRMEKHSENALAVARFLEGHPKVKRVYYPGLPSHPQYSLARKQMKNGFSGMVAFEIKGGRKEGARFLNNLNLCMVAISLGAVETLIEHPASMTHASVSAEELKKGGISEGMIRMSVGIENKEDIIADLEQGLRKI